MSQRKNDDLVAYDLIRQCEREPVEHHNASIGPKFPLRSCFRKSTDQCDHGVDLVFELLTETGLARLVVVDFVIDLGDRASMKPNLH